MSTPSKIIDRIRRLYAMANDSSSPNEAAIAAKRCRVLMDEYQITRADLEQSAFSNKVIKEGQRIPKWYVHLGIQVAQLNDCQFHRSASDECLFRGLDADVVVATLTMQYLVESVERQWKAYKKMDKTANANSFRMGFAIAVGNRIQEQIEHRQQLVISDGTSLVVSKQKLIESEFGVVSYSRSSYRSNDSRAYAAGNNAGLKTGLDAQVGKRDNNSLETSDN